MGIRNTLVIGNTYTKRGFGIRGWYNLSRADQIVEGELFSFFNLYEEQEIDNGKNNRQESDGFVYGVSGHDWALILPEEQTDLHRRIFVKRRKGILYEYIGETTHERRYDNTRNKAFF